MMRAAWDFLWDFVVGDDWVPAAGIVGLLAVTALLVHAAHANPWWLVPPAVVMLLGTTVWRALPRPARNLRRK
jgi:hypothetical protein